jgi:hypothetical protein
MMGWNLDLLRGIVDDGLLEINSVSCSVKKIILLLFYFNRLLSWCCRSRRVQYCKFLCSRTERFLAGVSSTFLHVFLCIRFF